MEFRENLRKRLEDKEFARRSSAAKIFIKGYIERQVEELKNAYDDVFDISKSRVR